MDRLKAFQTMNEIWEIADDIQDLLERYDHGIEPTDENTFEDKQDLMGVMEYLDKAISLMSDISIRHDKKIKKS